MCQASCRHIRTVSEHHVPPFLSYEFRNRKSRQRFSRRLLEARSLLRFPDERPVPEAHVPVAGGAKELEHPFHPVGDPQEELLPIELEFPSLVMARFPPADCEQQGILVHPGVVGRVGPGPGALFRPPQRAVAGDLNGKGRRSVTQELSRDWMPSMAMASRLFAICSRSRCCSWLSTDFKRYILSCSKACK